MKYIDFICENWDVDVIIWLEVVIFVFEYEIFLFLYNFDVVVCMN